MMIDMGFWYSSLVELQFYIYVASNDADESLCLRRSSTFSQIQSLLFALISIN